MDNAPTIDWFGMSLIMEDLYCTSKYSRTKKKIIINPSHTHFILNVNFAV